MKCDMMSVTVVAEAHYHHHLHDACRNLTVDSVCMGKMDSSGSFGHAVLISINTSFSTDLSRNMPVTQFQ